MNIDLSWAVGQVIEAVEYEDGSGPWWFGCQGHGGLRVDCPWQLLVAGRLHRTSGDHGRQYGLAATVDAAAEALALLSRRTVEAIEVDPASADLEVQFDGDVVLRTFADSTGYELWHLIGPDGQEVVGQGGRAVLLRGADAS